MGMNNIEDDLAEFLNKYKHHVEYSDRSDSIKIIENALKHIRNSESEKQSLKIKLDRVEEDNCILEDRIKNIQKNHSNINQKLIEEINNLIKLIYNTDIGHKKHSEISIISGNIFSLLDEKL